jgi:regulator of sigma E protease
MYDFLIAVVAFVVLVGLMVVVHEFGHFAVAKLCGVRVEAFSFGFGPRLFGYKYGDTDYKICLLPLGGFVKMTGEAPEQNLDVSGAPLVDLSDDPGAFTNHPRWQRMLIGLAGPVSNFILAFVLMVFYYGCIHEVPRHEITTTTIEWVKDGSAAAQAGFQPGDVIRHFETVANPTWDDVEQRAALNQGQTVPVTVDRNGQIIQTFLSLPPATKGEDFDVSDAGAIPMFGTGPIGVQHVEPGWPAAEAGLRDGDALQSVDGHAFHTVQALLAYLHSGKGKPVSLVVVRNGVTLPPIVAHPTNLRYRMEAGLCAGADSFQARSAAPQAGGGQVEKVLRRELHADCRGDWTNLYPQSRCLPALRPGGHCAHGRRRGGDERMAAQVRAGRAISLNLGILNLLPFPFSTAA